MPVYKLATGSYAIDVRHNKALPGYRRIRTTAHEPELAAQREAAIKQALVEYGKWPVRDGDKRLADLPTSGLTSNLVEAFTLARQNRWVGKRCDRDRRIMVENIQKFFVARGLTRMDDLTTADVEAFVAHLSEDRGPVTVNIYLSALSVVCDFARQRTPPLMTKALHIKRATSKKLPKWWLNLDMLPKVIAHCDTDPLSFHNLKDYIVWAISTGLRVEESMRVRHSSIIGLDTPRPVLMVPGTKTNSSAKAIPLFKDAVIVARRIMARTDDLFFPEGYKFYQRRWNELRVDFGWEADPTATLKSLRRTFAKVCNDRGIEAFDLMRLLRHTSVNTTQGYLDLVGDGRLEDIRDRYEGLRKAPHKVF